MMTLAEARSKMANLSNRAKSMKDKADAIVDTALQTVEVGSVALLSGTVDGYTGNTLALGGIPADLAGAVALHGFAAFSGMKNAHHLANMGDGLIAAFAVKQGLKLGKRMKDNKDAGRSIVSGDDEPRQMVAGPPAAYGAPYGQQTGLQTYAGG